MPDQPNPPAAPAPKPAEESSGTWKWVVGIGLGLVVGFWLARAMGRNSAPAAPPVYPAEERAPAPARTSAANVPVQPKAKREARPT